MNFALNLIAAAGGRLRRIETHPDLLGIYDEVKAIIEVYVMYPNTRGTTFDAAEYYRTEHIPLN